MLKDEIEKKTIKKGPEKVTWVNISNLWPGSQDWDNPMESK
jgi:hypothetical protein